MSKREINQTARFWIWLNGGWVKISLRPGQQLVHVDREDTDEGWSVVCNTWEHMTGYVERTYHCDSRDCDGRHGYTNSQTCLILDLAARKTEIEGAPPLPMWEEMRSETYDQFAEAAGY